MDPSSSSLVRNLQIDKRVWEETTTELNAGKYDLKVLTDRAKETRSHIKLLVQAPLQNIAEGSRAIEQAQSLQGQIEATLSKINDLQRQGKQIPNSANQELTKTMNKIEALLLELGKKQQTLTLSKELDAASSLTNRIKSLLGGRAAAGSAVSSGPEGFRLSRPEGPSRPYRTFSSDSTKQALPYARELAVGVDHDTSFVRVEAGEKSAALPKIFARDTIQGGFRIFLNGKSAMGGATREERAVNAFEALNKALQDPNAAYLLATLLDQTHSVPLAETAAAVFKENPKGGGSLCDVKLSGNDLHISIKNVMLGRETPPRAVMFKRQLTIPLSEFKVAADILSKNRPVLEGWDKSGIEAQTKEAKNYRAQLAGKELLFFTATAEDSYSSPIATKELALELLAEF